LKSIDNVAAFSTLQLTYIMSHISERNAPEQLPSIVEGMQQLTATSSHMFVFEGQTHNRIAYKQLHFK